MNLSEVVKNLSYKPGWHFALSTVILPEEETSLFITAEVLDSRTLKPVQFAIRRLIPDLARSDEATFLSWWKTILKEAEYHELREFARYKGELIDNPHATEYVFQD